MSQRSPLSGILGSLPWPVAESVSAMITGAVTVFVIARLIGAENFGRSSIALGLIVIMLVGVNSLVHDALVRMPDLQPEDVDAGFSASIALAIVFSAIAAFSAPFIGDVFDDPHIAALIWGFIPMLPLAAVSEILIAERRRTLDFRTVAQNQIAARLLGGTIGVVAAFQGAGAWSIVMQYVAFAAFSTVAMLAHATRWPRLRFSWARLSPMLGFCGPIIASQLLTQGTSRLVLMGMGHWHGLAFAGYWSVATRIAESTFGGLIQAAYNVGLAHFSLQQNARDQLAVSLREAQAVAVIIAVPTLAAVAAAAEPITLLLLGEKWTPVSVLMLGPLLASYLLIRRMFVTTALRVIGLSSASLVSSMVEGVAVLVALVIAGRISPVAVTVINPFGVMIGFLPLIYLLAREFQLSGAQQLALIGRDLAFGLAAFALGRQAITLVPFESLFIDTIVAGSTAFVVAATLLIWSDVKLVKALLGDVFRKPAGLEQ
jgi:teichuronic acid exporter